MRIGQHDPAWDGGTTTPANSGLDKVKLLRAYVEIYGCRSLVETGLFNGAGSGMPLMLDGTIAEYVAIDYQERNLELGKEAVPAGRFLLGDSGEVLRYLLDGLEEPLPPCLFWLDAHGIHEHEPTPSICPVMAELDAIFAWKHARTSVVLVDDLWGFGTITGWPTLVELRERIRREDGFAFEELSGVLRITPA